MSTRNEKNDPGRIELQSVFGIAEYDGFKASELFIIFEPDTAEEVFFSWRYNGGTVSLNLEIVSDNVCQHVTGKPFGFCT